MNILFLVDATENSNGPWKLDIISVIFIESHRFHNNRIIHTQLYPCFNWMNQTHMPIFKVWINSASCSPLQSYKALYLLNYGICVCSVFSFSKKELVFNKQMSIHHRHRKQVIFSQMLCIRMLRAHTNWEKKTSFDCETIWQTVRTTTLAQGKQFWSEPNDTDIIQTCWLVWYQPIFYQLL